MRVGYLGYTHTLGICNAHCFPLQQWLHGRACMLRFTSIVCRVSVFTVGYTADDAETMKTLPNVSVATHN